MEVLLKHAELKQGLRNVFYLVFILVLKALLCIVEHYKWFYLDDFCEASIKNIYLYYYYLFLHICRNVLVSAHNLCVLAQYASLCVGRILKPQGALQHKQSSKDLI